MTRSPLAALIVCHGAESEARDVFRRLDIHIRTDNVVQLC